MHRRIIAWVVFPMFLATVFLAGATSSQAADRGLATAIGVGAAIVAAGALAYGMSQPYGYARTYDDRYAPYPVYVDRPYVHVDPPVAYRHRPVRIYVDRPAYDHRPYRSHFDRGYGYGYGYRPYPGHRR